MNFSLHSSLTAIPDAALACTRTTTSLIDAGNKNGIHAPSQERREKFLTPSLAYSKASFKIVNHFPQKRCKTCKGEKKEKKRPALSIPLNPQKKILNHFPQNRSKTRKKNK
jgi:hypothetical protein